MLSVAEVETTWRFIHSLKPSDPGSFFLNNRDDAALQRGLQPNSGMHWPPTSAQTLSFFTAVKRGFLWPSNLLTLLLCFVVFGSCGGFGDFFFFFLWAETCMKRTYATPPQLRRVLKVILELWPSCLTSICFTPVTEWRVCLIKTQLWRKRYCDYLSLGKRQIHLQQRGTGFCGGFVCIRIHLPGGTGARKVKVHGPLWGQHRTACKYAVIKAGMPF